MKPVFSTAAAFLVLSSLALAGDGFDGKAAAPFPSPRHSGEGVIAFTANNVQLLSWIPLSEFPGGNNSASDCWGYTSPSGREYAVIGLSHGTGFVEVTDPGLPTLVHFEPHNNQPSGWRTVKTYGSFAYTCSEGGGGIQIFDLTDIDQGQITASAIGTGNCTTTHTVAVDEVSGFLYRAGGTVVLVTASVDETVPEFLKGQGRGWITAEYQMHPRSNPKRRENRDGRERPLGGRAREIQRLIGRSLRAAVCDTTERRLEEIGLRPPFADLTAPKARPLGT